MQARETFFTLHGKKIAAKIWHEGQGVPLLALHGWLDNAASFDKLAPLLNHHIVAIDLPGHGHSDHKSPSSFLHLIDYAIDAIDVADHLGWQQFGLLGHSLGAAICSLIAGAIPHRIKGLGLIDGLGPFTQPTDQAPSQLRLFLEERTKKPNKTPSRYDDVETALQARLKANVMERSSALLLVERGLKQLDNGQWTWRTDPRLLMPIPLMFTEGQILAFLHAITAPVSIIRPESGYAFPPELIAKRLGAVQHAQVHTIAGHHHVHLDNPESVANYLAPFFNSLEKTA
jgi:pimeloyl-ACP methyl ester carboxylesterase